MSSNFHSPKGVGIVTPPEELELLDEELELLDEELELLDEELELLDEELELLDELDEELELLVESSLPPQAARPSNDMTNKLAITPLRLLS